MNNNNNQSPLNNGVQPSINGTIQPVMNNNVQSSQNNVNQLPLNNGVQPSMNDAIQPVMNNNVQSSPNNVNQPIMNPGIQTNSIQQQIPGSNNKNKKLYFVIGAVVILILIVVAVILIINNNNNNNNKAGTSSEGIYDYEEEQEKLEKEAEKLAKKVSISAVTTSDNSLLITVKNNNNSIVNGQIKIEYYDTNGGLVDSDDTIVVGLKEKSETYFTDKSFEEYATYKLTIDVTAREGVKTYFDNLDIKENKVDNGITFQVFNNNEDTIDTLTAVIVFYKGNKVVGTSSSSAYYIKKGSNANLKFFNPVDTNYDDVDYDSYKFFISESYTISYY